MPFIKFSLIRFGIAAAVFALCLWLHVGLVFSFVFAILISWAVSYLAFRKQRDEAAAYLQRRYNPAKPHRAKTEQDDNDAEDGLTAQR